MTRLSPKRLFALFLIFAFPSLSLAGPPTAKQTIASFGKIQGSDQAARVVGMVGFYGQDQPPQWAILKPDWKVANLMHEYMMRDGKIVGERRFWRDPKQDLPTVAIPFEKIAIDSSRAFVLADQEAKKAGLGFDMIHYQLRGRDLRNEPVWVLNLVDGGQQSIGVLYISAITGETLRSVWNRSKGYTSAPAPTPNNTSAPAPAPTSASGAPQSIAVPSSSSNSSTKAKGLIPQLKQKRQAKKAQAYAAPPVR